MKQSVNHIKHANNTRPAIAILRDRVLYDPLTGVMTWNANASLGFVSEHGRKVWAAKFGGKPIEKRCHGYIVVTISTPSGTSYCVASRVAWALMTDEWPEHEVDHRNRDRADNRWDNLREGTHTQNNRNKEASITSHTGVRGVYPHHDGSGRFIAQIRRDGKQRYLGTFDTLESAAEARYQAAKTVFGDFAPQ